MDKNYKNKMQNLKDIHKKKVKSASDDRGIIIVNTGKGKGKSTAAFGTAFRAIGQGFNVAIVQFIKGVWKTGEMQIFKEFESITHIISGEGFTWETQDREKDIIAAKKGWGFAKDVILGKTEKTYKVLVLDELNIVLHLKYIDIDEVIDVLSNKPDNLNIILTGRSAPQKIIDIADTVTNMEPIKHAFQGGIKAQRGIEF